MANNATISNAQARRLAQKLNDVSLKLKELKDQKDELEKSLRSFVKSTGETDLGVMMAYKRKARATLSFPEGSNKSQIAEIKAQLITCLPAYTKLSLDLTTMNNKYADDSSLRKVLRMKKVMVDQKEEWYFKHIS